MNSSHRFVGLDIGSNTVSCCLLEAGTNDALVQQDVSLPVRLSEGLEPGGLLKKEAIIRALEAVERLHREFRMDAATVRAAGTAVLRMTSHPEHFTGPASQILGVPVDIISGEEEALLTNRGAVADLPLDGDPVVLDIGGQSTELSCAAGQGVAVSMPLGVVSLTEIYLSPVPTTAEIGAARAHVREVLADYAPRGLTGTLVCVGGTPTTLSLLERRLTGWHREKVHGYVISMNAVHGWLRVVSAVSPKERIDRYGMRPMRADVFPAGLLALQTIMEHYGMDSLMVSANGLRVGLALSLMDQSA